MRFCYIISITIKQIFWLNCQTSTGCDKNNIHVKRNRIKNQTIWKIILKGPFYGNIRIMKARRK